MTRCPVLTTDRLVLRPLVEADLDDYVAMLRMSEVQASLHLDPDVGPDEAWAQMAIFRGQWELRGTGQWAIEEISTGRLVGRAGLHRPERVGWPGVEVGWTFHPDRWGRGYATEVGAASIDYAFAEVEVDGAPVAEVFSLILTENVRSEAVAQRLGLVKVDERVLAFFPEAPHGVWRLGRDEWSELRTGT